MYKTKLLITITGSLILNACVIMEPINIQVLKPPTLQLSFPEKNAILINHAIIYDEKDRSNDSLYTTSYFQGFTYKFRNSPLYNLKSDTAIIVLKTNEQTFINIDSSSLVSILENKNSTMAIVLENFQVIYNEPVPINFSHEYGYYSTLSVENSSLWKIYNAIEKKYIDDYLLKDTLFWDAAGNSPQEVIDQFPTLNEAAIQSCFYAGMKYAERIAPIWNVERRYLLLPNNWSFYKASDYVENNQWNEAIEIWRKIAYGNKKRLAAMACYNMAVASEVFDNIDAALDWAAKSYLLRKKKYVEEYIHLLEKRKKDKSKIQSQN